MARRGAALARGHGGLSYQGAMVSCLARMRAILVVLAILAAAPAAMAADIVVFAAASLKNVLDEAASRFEAATAQGVAVSYAGSASLARQIEQGAPADIFISANPDWVSYLERDSHLRPGSRAILAGNRLVLIGQGGASVDLTPGADLAGRLEPDGRIALALTRAVPAGIYARAALDWIAAWDSVAPFVVETDNVRAALRLVSLGEARLGIVYATDAHVAPEVTVLGTFPEAAHPPIRYHAAVTADSPHPRAAAFLEWLAGPDGQAVFARHGFGPGAAE